MRCSKWSPTWSSARPISRTRRRSSRRSRATSLKTIVGTGRLVEGPGQERLQDAAGRRPVAEEGRQARAGHHHQHAGTGNPGRRRAGAAELVSQCRDRARLACRHLRGDRAASPRCLTARMIRPAGEAVTSLSSHARMTILAVERLSKRYGALLVTDDVSLALDAGEALGIIGPERRGQDDAVQPDRRHGAARRRRASSSTAADVTRAAGARSAAIAASAARSRSRIPSPA